MNKLPTKLAELKKIPTQINQELDFYTEKLKKAREFSKIFYETREFLSDFWKKRIEQARQKVEPEGGNRYWKLESEIENKTQFNIYYYKALDLFNEEVKKWLEQREKNLTKHSNNIEYEIMKLERQEIRRNLKKQGRELLPCSNHSKMGCWGNEKYYCQNCQINYKKNEI